MNSITRKTMLYKTGVEYGDYTMNHVFGCAHGCKYPCYAYLMKKRFGEVASHEDWIAPKIVSNTLELLDDEIPRLKDKIKSVQLCFTTDPFMYGYEEVAKMSIKSIQKLNEAGIKCNILTKGILPIKLAEYSKENEYGITIITLSESFRRKIEPGAAPIEKRIQALKNLHDKGCKTWVSIEPYPTPNIFAQNLGELLEEIGFVDRIIFGKMNYNKNVSLYRDHKSFYNVCANNVIEFCKDNKIDCYIKNKTISI